MCPKNQSLHSSLDTELKSLDMWSTAEMIWHAFISNFFPLSFRYGNDSRSTSLDDVSCSSSSYLAITQCSFSTFISSLRTDNTDVIVACCEFLGFYMLST